jgi:hypothetical protein
MKKYAIALMLAAAVVAGAKEPKHERLVPKKAWTYETLVPACRDWARRFEPTFDAYWDATIGKARCWGVNNGVGNFQFDKCMSANGLPMYDIPVAAVTTTTTLPQQMLWRVAYRMPVGSPDRSWKWLTDGPFDSRYACEGFLLRKLHDNSPEGAAKGAMDDFQCFGNPQ